MAAVKHPHPRLIATDRRTSFNNPFPRTPARVQGAKTVNLAHLTWVSVPQLVSVHSINSGMSLYSLVTCEGEAYIFHASGSTLFLSLVHTSPTHVGVVSRPSVSPFLSPLLATPFSLFLQSLVSSTIHMVLLPASLLRSSLWVSVLEVSRLISLRLSLSSTSQPNCSFLQPRVVNA